MLAIFFPDWDEQGEIPHPTTGRSWLLRLGLFKLQRPKTPANDWVWLVDHTVQLGKAKCLMIAGVRLSQLPPAGQALELQHLEPLAILPVQQSNQRIVQEQLEAQAVSSGVPRANRRPQVSLPGLETCGRTRGSVRDRPQRGRTRGSVRDRPQRVLTVSSARAA